MRIDLHTHTRASDGTQTAEELRARGGASQARRARADRPRHRRGVGRGGPDRRGGRDRAGARHRDQHPPPRARGAPARLPARPDVPAAGRAPAQDPRRPQQPGAGDAGAAARRGRRRRHRRRAPGRRRHRGHRPTPRGGRAGGAGRRARPRHGVPAVPQPRPAGLRQPVRRPAGRDDPGGRRGRRRDRARAPVGPARPRLDAGECDRRAGRAGAGRPRGGPPGPPAGGPRAAPRDRAAPRPRGHRLQRPPRPGKHDHELGCNTTAPEEYERLLELAAAAAARSERPTPEVVR